MFKSFNDLLALIVIIGVPALIAGTKAAGIDLTGEVTGVLMAGWTLAVQYYFRKAPPVAEPSGGTQ